MLVEMDMDNKVNSVVAFFSGDLFTTIIFMYANIGAIDFVHPILKVIFTLIIGVVGGFGGLLGKDIYEKIKEFCRTHKNK